MPNEVHLHGLIWYLQQQKETHEDAADETTELGRWNGYMAAKFEEALARNATETRST